MITQGDPENVRSMRAMFGPQQVDQQIRQAISFCWMLMPDERKTDWGPKSGDRSSLREREDYVPCDR